MLLIKRQHYRYEAPQPQLKDVWKYAKTEHITAMHIHHDVRINFTHTFKASYVESVLA
jgi:hypothetical protein